MSRIQQILAKAERDGTARRMGSPAERSAEPPAPYAAPATFESRDAAHRDAHESRSAATAHNLSVIAHEPRVFEDDPGGIQRDSDRTQPDPGRAEDADAGLQSAPSSSRAPRWMRRRAPFSWRPWSPLSPAAEQYRSLRSRIGRAESVQPMRVIQITSPGKNDGKTVTALNLALTMAQEFQRRVLVIDMPTSGGHACHASSGCHRVPASSTC